MCQAPNHLFNDCPKVSDLDSNTRCVVFTSLLQACGSSQSQTEPLSDSCLPHAWHVHAIVTDDTSMPFDESELDFTSSINDSENLEDTESHPDFQ